MGYIANTPEDRLERSDSKDPNTTCKGLTGAGNLCRNPVTPVNGKKLSPTVVEESHYCHHHRDQAASRSAQSSPGPRLSGRPVLEQRSSIDTLADRLGLVDVGSNPTKKQSRPQGGRPNGNTRPPKKEKEMLHFCFCFSLPIDEVHDDPQPAPRPQPRPVQNGGSAPMPRPSSQLLSPPSNGRPRPSASSSSRKSSSQQPSPQPLSTSQTAQYLSLIPPSTDPQTASALMAELARPYGSSEEPGYIYMFWIMPTSKKERRAAGGAGRWLASPSPGAGARGGSVGRATSFGLRKRPTGGASAGDKMLIKIGRAAKRAAPHAAVDQAVLVRDRGAAVLPLPAGRERRVRGAAAHDAARPPRRAADSHRAGGTGAARRAHHLRRVQPGPPRVVRGADVQEGHRGGGRGHPEMG
ncbi:uncharacterized protein GLRG_01022 [Colletotrichum graminicola M1.001]|uniref:Uncharacterized protein n=1 Tax=Colletotrichum graminicola (strain M1.001 / M2 / FGSC 10212) TaxID=645133 RepID=E3Q5B1_COLGM|nr:uncharacterized protein GLRG_01022 [Colletotrichum graminicola M1.001]EFQ25878.1 hypothetical protein GLRG_01022 [Colletotrichum graminicola M1.001]